MDGIDVSRYVSARSREYDAEFHEVNDTMREAAEDTDGYRGNRTWTDPERDEILVVYHWESLNTLDTFVADSNHERAKRRWTEWDDAFDVTVTEVIDSYGSGFGTDADPPE